MTGPALPEDCESFHALSIWCSVQQIAVMLLSVLSWLADVENQQYCRTKHNNDLKKKCCSDILQLLLVEVLGLLPSLFFHLVFEVCYELEHSTGLYGYQSHPLLSDNSCPVAMKRFSEMPCKRDEYPSVTAERFFSWLISC